MKKANQELVFTVGEKYQQLLVLLFGENLHVVKALPRQILFGD